MTDEDFRTDVVTRLARIEANQTITVEALRVVCQRLNLSDKLEEIAAKANGHRESSTPPEPEGTPV